MVLGSSRASGGGLTCWPEAVRYLLRSNTTCNAIQSVILVFRDTKQKSGELETSCSIRLNRAFHRCSTVYYAEERCTMLIDVLVPTIRPLVARCREERRKITYLERFQYAQAKSDVLHARSVSKAVRSSQLLYLEEGNCSASLQQGSARSGYDKLHLAGEPPGSLYLSQLPSTEAPTAVNDPFVYAGLNVQALLVPYVLV